MSPEEQSPDEMSSEKLTPQERDVDAGTPGLAPRPDDQPVTTEERLDIDRNEIDRTRPDMPTAPFRETDVHQARSARGDTTEDRYVFEDSDIYGVVQAYVAAQASAPDDSGVLNEWMRQYPQFHGELLAASWQTWAVGSDWLTGAEADLAEDAEIVASGRDVLEALLPQEAVVPASTAPLTSLLAAARAQGLSSRDLAQALHLDVPLLARLEQRLIRAATLPLSLVARLAEALDRSAADVASYLRGAPSLAAGAHYKAQQAPVAGGQADFAEILTSSSADVRAFWQGEQDVLGEGNPATEGENAPGEGGAR